MGYSELARASSAGYFGPYGNYGSSIVKLCAECEEVIPAKDKNHTDYCWAHQCAVCYAKRLSDSNRCANHICSEESCKKGQLKGSKFCGEHAKTPAN